jgi:polyisoprenoid-binding protein YceI
VFRQVAGGFTFDDQAMTVSDIRIEVKTASVDTGHRKRDDHLRSDDFLDARKYPVMTFVARSGERTGERTGRIAGELTLRGVTRPLVLEVTLNGMRDYPFADRHFAVGVSARGTLRRSDYGMTYGVAEGMVGDEVELVVEMEGRRL